MTENEDEYKITHEDDADSDSADAPTASDEQTDTELRLTDSVREFLKKDRNHQCEICAAENADLEVHHRVPRAEGGTNHPKNLVVLCRDCHQKHHDNTPISKRLAQKDIASTDSSAQTDAETAADAGADDASDSDPASETSSDSEANSNIPDEPLPPKTTPNGADEQILSAIEEHGAMSTGELAELLDYSKQYIRRQGWKLSGEQLLARTEDSRWASAECVDDESRKAGLPDSSKRAFRAGRDEMLRRLSAAGMSHTEVASITDLSRSTIDIGVNRARALAIAPGNTFPDEDLNEVDVAMIATRLSSLIDLIERAPDNE